MRNGLMTAVPVVCAGSEQEVAERTRVCRESFNRHYRAHRDVAAARRFATDHARRVGAPSPD